MIRPESALEIFLLNAAILLLVLAFAVGVTFVLVRQQARRRLRAERMAAMGTAAARILHQLKNPLQTMLLHAEMLGDDAVVQDGASRQEVSGAIVSGAGRINELLSELTTYASGAARQLAFQPLRLRGLVEELVRTWRPQAEREGTRLEMEGEEDPVVQADPYYLRQALENLVRNAREAVAGRPGARVRVALRRRDRHAVVEVADNGPGLSAAQARSVFEPFVTTKSKGMGLGLAICREIVEAHGGRVEARGRPGAGAVFRVYLPLGSLREESPTAASGR